MSPADLVVVGATIRTLDFQHPTAAAVAVHAGEIVAVGDEREVRAQRGPRTEVLDLRGATVVPGLVDGHIHPVLGADATEGIDLTGCTDLDQLLAALRSAAATMPPHEWVRAWGLDPNALGGAPLHRSVIDDALDGRPGLVMVFDGHAALASSAALTRAGVTGPRAFDTHAEIVCDAEGRPTGHLLEEEAVGLVRAAIPPASFDARRRAVAGVLAAMAATGLTGGHVMDLADEDVALYEALDGAGQLPLRLRLAPWCRPGDDRDRLGHLIDLQQRRGRLWQVGGVKLFMDGTIDGGTAWLFEPDRHGQSTASYWPDPSEYTQAVHTLAQAGVPTATHAIGDAAVAHVLDTLEPVAPATGPARHRIEHIETVSDDQLPRFPSLGVVASMQPTHATDYTRADHSDNWSRRLGDERAARGWRCRDLLDAGATVVLGSDWPVADYDPRRVLSAAQTRRPVRRPDAAPVGLKQALTAVQALAGYTTSPAAASGDQSRSGRIAVGFRADFTAFGADPLVVPAATLPDVPVIATVVDGVVRHRAQA